MSVQNDAQVHNGTPTYLASGDPAYSTYYPAWLDNLADDVTLEGSMLDGAVQGAEALRTIVAGVRTLYGDTQEFHFIGPCGDNALIEDYIAQVDGMPLGGVVVVTRNADGQTQHVVASYRPRSSVLHFSRLLGAMFAESSFGQQFAKG